ncbi:MAG TPA: hypothetical protein VHD84_00865, partial [Candidatus Saccharimonadales bacterium]|nr:hypothetical protein [Candidatus Saccharimonadales bacterium]
MTTIYLIAGGAIVAAAIIALVIVYIKRRQFRSNSDTMAAFGLAVSPEALKNQKWRPDFLLSAIQDGVVMVGKDNVVHLLNPAASSITGWAAKEADGL